MTSGQYRIQSLKKVQVHVHPNQSIARQIPCLVQYTRSTVGRELFWERYKQEAYRKRVYLLGLYCTFFVLIWLWPKKNCKDITFTENSPMGSVLHQYFPNFCGATIDISPSLCQGGSRQKKMVDHDGTRTHNPVDWNVEDETGKRFFKMNVYCSNQERTSDPLIMFKENEDVSECFVEKKRRTDQ